jgi:hypothetical protein
VVNGRRVMIHWLLVAVAMVAVATRGGAQTGVRRSRSMTTSAGFGFGSATFSCPACLPPRQLSLTGKIRGGMTVNSTWTIGLEGNLWIKQFQRPDGHSAAHLEFLDVAAQWYPAGGSEFFVSGGAGVALFHEEINNTGAATVKVSAVSPAVVLGLGWDIPVHQRWAVTPYMDFLTGGGASANVTGAGARVRFQPALVQIGVAVTRLPPWRDAAAAWRLPRAKRPAVARRVCPCSTRNP